MIIVSRGVSCWAKQHRQPADLLLRRRGADHFRISDQKMNVAAVTLAVGAAAAVVAGVVLGIAAYSALVVIRPRRDWHPDDWEAATASVPDLEHVRFTNSQGNRLAGWYAPPEPGGAMAIVCHGFGTNRLEGLDLLPWLRENGHGVLFFDFQAHGESDGRYTTVGLREVDDLLCAVRYVQGRLGDAVQIVVVGFSMGASIAIMAAAQCPAIRAVIADSAFATLHSAISRSFRKFFRLPPRLFARPTIWFAERFTGGRVGSVAPIASVAAIAPRPLLLIQGTGDAVVDPEDCVLLYAAAGEPKSVWRVDGAGHVGVRSLYRDEYYRRIKECLAQVLATPQGAG
jgi:alpha-beta hydrolase superfamily lysophospholipase